MTHQQPITAHHHNITGVPAMNASPIEPWVIDNLFTPTGDDLDWDARAYTSIDVRPVMLVEGEDTNPGTRGDGSTWNAWSVYLTGRESDTPTLCVADLPSEGAADALAEALYSTFPNLRQRPDEPLDPIRVWAEVESAQCLWEAVLDRVRGDPHPAASAFELAIRYAVENVGYGEVRLWMRDLAKPCHTAWVNACAHEGYASAFDWEWCPDWLASLDWSNPGDCPKIKAPAPAKPEPVPPVEVAPQLADALHGLMKALSNPELVSLAEPNASDADDQMNAAMIAAEAVLARVGMEA